MRRAGRGRKRGGQASLSLHCLIVGCGRRYHADQVIERLEADNARFKGIASEAMLQIGGLRCIRQTPKL